MINFVSFYKAMNPEISLDFPVAKDESDYENQLVDGFHKVLRGFQVLNELSEWAILAGKSGRLIAERPVDSNDELFDDFAHALMDDLATVTSRFVDFKPDQSVDLMSLYTEVIDYLQLYFEADRLWGDFEDRIGGALIHLSMSDSKIENALYIAWILDINDPANERSNQFYSYVFEHLNKRLLRNSDESKAIAERVYVGPLVVSIVATDNDVEFLVDGWQEDISKGEWDEEYKFAQIYKNDKQTPNSKEDWLDLMAPAEGQGFRLGIRSYRTYEEAIKAEKDWVSAIGPYFRQKSLILERGKSIKKSQYFIQTDVYGNPFSYWRRVWRDGVMSEECWQESKSIWFPSQGRLLWMQISGECTLQEISEDYAISLVPEAFKS